MAYENNHYIPQFILRRFGNKINRYNLDTGEVKIKGSTMNAFSKNKIYPEWLEKKLGELESKIANLIDNKILKADGEIILTREENILIKKFFTVATLRIPDSSFFTKKHNEPEESLKKQGFKEVTLQNESIQEYAYRTLKVVLESNSVEELYNHPEVTYEACKWFQLYFSCYITIWDSKKSKEDFFITDNGMNCEHDKTRFSTFFFGNEIYHNEKDEMLKNGYVSKKMMENINNKEKTLCYFSIMNRMKYVHANYYLFAVSNTRTIALINPFYRLYYDSDCLSVLGEEPDVWPTLLSREAMRSNNCNYVEENKYSPNDEFKYAIKDLSLEEVIIVNTMMLDRTTHWLGFDDSSKIARSLNVYSLIDKNEQRNHFDKLIEFLYSMGYEFPKVQKYLDIKQKLVRPQLSEKEMSYVAYYYDLIKKNGCCIK